MSFSIDDHKFMSRALHLAKKGIYTTAPNPNVGCVLVKNGEIIGEGWHEKAGEAHAEIHALKQAGNNAEGATAYVTLEPCCHHGKTPPCTEALIKAKVSRVVAAMIDPHSKVAGQGLKQLEEAGIFVESGLLEEQAKALNSGFIKRMQKRLPYVRCKLAMSLDGRTAMASGESKWITSAAAREDVQHLRARSGAILTGVGTVLADDPSMTVRLDGFDSQPLRVVVDTNLSMPADAKMLREHGKTILMTCSADEAVTQVLTDAGADIHMLPYCNGSVDLKSVLEQLSDMHINDVLVETGATLSGAMLQAGLIDEIIIYMAPVLMGNNARGLFALPGLDSMQDKIELDIIEQRSVGQDIRITAKVRQLN
ncbi:MAG: bifunctional diaminohydroxyphosphoribosylaminopyrimidine deaminase/5-amino-6-(5-phosphoribosylamino)uracil reductase RibD [Gammaproteobacteria bacterium]|nr:bifunctional diaminohydroxyphosphoribosylaminopyrimidine deaminase/5-amino-6-(5-phosphoribosylamino)uracil reductase RibD [Gammaproteobacteria bacterium]MCW8986808.1 bifunctional diaminohydroxyphosphoribosylaminopyrimidine deaminase/5-amino-6-(5-phosphoribosylamino)uracil reductase RibD [Gammaproteobacteria bacterium]